MAKEKELWEIANPFGRPPIFKTPKDFWDAACKYFKWISKTPLMESKMFCFQGMTTTDTIPKMHAMTIQGLCLHMGINSDTFYDYEKKKDFSEIVGIVRQTIYEQKLSGAAADLLNASIISRELGLTDKIENTVKDTTAQDMSKLTDEELKEMARIQKKLEE